MSSSLFGGTSAGGDLLPVLSLAAVRVDVVETLSRVTDTSLASEDVDLVLSLHVGARVVGSRLRSSDLRLSVLWSRFAELLVLGLVPSVLFT